MPKKKENVKDDQEFACPNSSCGLVFSKPIKVKNLSAQNSEYYEACPRCLTAISIEESVPIVEAEPDTPIRDGRRHKIAHTPEEMKTEPVTSAQCAHHLGYLSERAKNENIPDECMVCENIVKCMLKAVNR